MEGELKICTGENGCGELLPATEEYFSKNKMTPSGLHSYCRGCLSKYKSEYYDKNKELIAKKKAKYYSDNRAWIIECTAKYYSDHRELVAERSIKYRAENREQINNRKAEDYSILREKVLIGYGHECVVCRIPESEFLAIEHIGDDGYRDRKIYGVGTKWFNHIVESGFPTTLQLLCHNHNWGKELGRRSIKLSQTYSAVATKKSNHKLRLEVFTEYGLICACCGEDNLDVLCIDHIGGGGGGHRRELRSIGTDIYRWLRRNNFPTGYQTLCQNCNKAFGHYGYCPHENKNTIDISK